MEGWGVLTGEGTLVSLSLWNMFVTGTNQSRQLARRRLPPRLVKHLLARTIHVFLIVTDSNGFVSFNFVSLSHQWASGFSFESHGFSSKNCHRFVTVSSVAAVTRIWLDFRPFLHGEKNEMEGSNPWWSCSPFFLTNICMGGFLFLDFWRKKNYFNAYINPDMVTSHRNSQAITFLFRAAG